MIHDTLLFNSIHEDFLFQVYLFFLVYKLRGVCMYYYIVMLLTVTFTCVIRSIRDFVI